MDNGMVFIVVIILFSLLEGVLRSPRPLKAGDGPLKPYVIVE